MAHGPAEELTGRRRYRPEVQQERPIGEVPLIVLQVEVSYWSNGPEGKPGKWACKWRDATPADIPEAQLCG